MKNLLRDHVLIRSEAMWALNALCGEDHPAKIARAQAEKHPESHREIMGWFAPLIAVADALAREVDIDDPDFRFLFQVREGFHAPLSELMLRDQGAVVSEAGILEAFSYFLDEDAPAGTLTSTDALISHISRPAYPFAVRSAMLFALENFQQLYDYASGLADIAQRVIESHMDTLSPLIDTCRDQWNTDIGQMGLEETFAALGVPLKLDSGSYTLYPSLFRSNAFVLLQWPGGEAVMFFGVLLRQLKALDGGAAFSSQQLQSFFKVLADPTKYEIIRLLGGGSMYGGQLAQALGLTAATVSHHLTRLMALSLVRVRKDGVKIHYTLAEDTLKAFLDAARGRLLG